MSDKFNTIELQASYGIGQQMGQQLRSNPFDGLNLDAVYAGIADGFNQQESQVSQQELHEAFTAIHERMQAAKNEQFKDNIEAGKKFLEENGQREGVVTLDSGLQYEVLNTGDGEKPSASSTVRTHYHGTLTNGQVFDSSYDRGQPAEFPVGGVIKGWTEALQLMTVGSKWKLFVPSDLAYGEQGAGGAIGPFETLLLDVELLDIL